MNTVNVFFTSFGEFVQPHFYFIAVGLLISCLVQFMSCVKRNTKSTIEQQKYKDSEIHDRLLILKMHFNYQISQRNRNFTY